MKMRSVSELWKTLEELAIEDAAVKRALEMRKHNEIGDEELLLRLAVYLAKSLSVTRRELLNSLRLNIPPIVVSKEELERIWLRGKTS